jgi:AcrR family transcriptional regulator
MQRAERESLILDAATERFALQGFTGVALTDIAEAAGVTKPLVYSYFGPKEDLYTACLDRAADNIVDTISAALVGVPPDIDMALVVIGALFTALEPDPHDWTLLYDAPVPPVAVLADRLHKQRKRIDGLAVNGVHQVATNLGVTDPNDISLATEIWTSILSALVRWWLAHRSHTAADMVDRSRSLGARIATYR